MCLLMSRWEQFFSSSPLLHSMTPLHKAADERHLLSAEQKKCCELSAHVFSQPISSDPSLQSSSLSQTKSKGMHISLAQVNSSMPHFWFAQSFSSDVSPWPQSLSESHSQALGMQRPLVRHVNWLGLHEEF